MKKLVTIILVFLLASCTRTVYIPQVEVRTDSVVHTEFIHHRDTIYQSEKIVVAGDTVFIDRYKYKEKTVYKEVRDTTIRVDSIPYPVPTPVKVEVVKYRTPGWCWLILSLTVLGIGAFLHRKLKGVRDTLR